MALKKRHDAALELDLLQAWHLMRGDAIWRFSFADRRQRPFPFESEEQRRAAWFANRRQLMSMAGERLPDGLAAELGLSPRYRSSGVTWASRQFPSAHYDYETGTNVPPENTKPRQVDAVSKGGRGKEGGTRKAARDLGLSDADVRRSKKIANLSPEAQQAESQTTKAPITRTRPRRAAAMTTFLPDQTPQTGQTAGPE